jgi:uncharacterized membrane protein YbjE (DUF340 family)
VGLIFGFIVLLVLFAGIAAGYFELIYADVVDFLLMLLLLLIGLDIGMSESRVERFKRAWKDATILSLGTLLGSLLAGFLMGIVLKMQIFVAISVAAGMGWYSLTGPFLAKTAGAFAGALGFTSNFFRELLTLIFYPKIKDRMSGISIGGATTMDSTLPVIAKFSPECSLMAFVHGFIISLFVPFLLTLLSYFY